MTDLDLRNRSSSSALSRLEGMMKPATAILVVWGVWILSWIVASPWSGHTAKRAGPGGELAYRIPIIVGAILTFGIGASPNVLGNRLYPMPPGIGGWGR
jgi:hypothetical protein